MKAKHGGARKGSGKKKTGSKTVRRQFSIDLDVEEILGMQMFKGLRSRIVNESLRETFERYMPGLQQWLAKRPEPKPAKD